MKRVESPVVGQMYVISFNSLRIAEVVGVKGDYVHYCEYQEDYHGKLECTIGNVVAHKATLFEKPEKWQDLPSDFMLHHMLCKIKGDTEIRKKLSDFRHETLQGFYFAKIGDDLRSQSFGELLKAAMPTCNHRQLCILRNLFQITHYMDKGVAQLSVYEDYKGQLTEEQLLALEENLQLYNECCSKTSNEKYPYCGLENRRKNSPCDLHHFLYGVNSILTDDKFYTMTLFPTSNGDNKSFSAIRFSQKHFDPNNSLQAFIENINKTEELCARNEDNSFSVVLEYLMIEGLGEDSFREKVEVPDFLNPDYHNVRLMTRSVKNDWFRYLIYITGYELRELYDTKVNRQHCDRQAWAFILNGSADMKYYILIK